MTLTAVKETKRKRRVGPKTTDRHALYQMSVQSPEESIKFFDRVYRKYNGKLPKVMKEDFCGTAYLCATWVKKRPDNVAIGVDLDRETLEWGKRTNIKPLGNDAKRVTLFREDVRSVTKPKADVITAFNFSYFIFKQPSELKKYFAAVRKSLAPGGIFVMDIFGGWEAQMEVTDKTRYSGYTYVWQQERFDPISNNALFHIHFRFHGGGGIEKAFTYDWRLYSIPEIREALAEVGFKESEIYWEGVDSGTNEGNGIFRSVRKAENCPGWNAYIVAR